MIAEAKKSDEENIKVYESFPLAQARTNWINKLTNIEIQQMCTLQQLRVQGEKFKQIQQINSKENFYKTIVRFAKICLAYQKYQEFIKKQEVMAHSLAGLNKQLVELQMEQAGTSLTVEE